MDKLISCPECKRTFKTERGFKTHEATHQSGKKFLKIWRLCLGAQLQHSFKYYLSVTP